MNKLRPFVLVLIVTVLAGCGPNGGEAPAFSPAESAKQDPLLGVWKRQSYPFGTIEIKPDSVKFVAGEGLAEPPRFLAYRRSDTCPYADTPLTASATTRYLVMSATKNCEGYYLNGDTLTMLYPPGGEGVVYVREKEGNSDGSPSGTASERDIILTDYSCGDNCYVSYVLPAAPADTLQALCAASLCGNWERWGELPEGLRNQRVLARFSVGKQYDGAGTVMRDDFPSVTDIRIGGPDPAE